MLLLRLKTTTPIHKSLLNIPKTGRAVCKQAASKLLKNLISYDLHCKQYLKQLLRESYTH